MGNEAQGQSGTWGMGHIGNRDTGANEAHRGYGVQGHEPHG